VGVVAAEIILIGFGFRLRSGVQQFFLVNMYLLGVSAGIVRSVKYTQMPAGILVIGYGFLIAHNATVFAHCGDQNFFAVHFKRHTAHRADGAVRVLHPGPVGKVYVPRLKQTCHWRS
jgi:hypothetical protein